jgi:hypothetical protein
LCLTADGLDPAIQGLISNILEENVLQPLLVSTSAIELATETVALILRIDDIQVSSVDGYEKTVKVLIESFHSLRDRPCDDSFDVNVDMRLSTVMTM